MLYDTSQLSNPRSQHKPQGEVMTQRRALAGLEHQQELGRLRARYEYAVLWAIESLPDDARVAYMRHRHCENQSELLEVFATLANRVMEAVVLLPEGVPVYGDRAMCPLCNSAARGPYQNIKPGWGYPKGLEGHIYSHAETGSCGVMTILRDFASDQMKLRLAPVKR
jgi:hypothetical protein